MKYLLDGKPITLDSADVISSGGEATVFRHNNQAIKIYTQPTADRAKKLAALLPLTSGLPPEVIAPQRLIYDEKGKTAVGFAMHLLDAGYAEVRKLATKKYRQKAGISAAEVTDLFINAWCTLSMIHRAGMVVGDFNDLNVMFKTATMLFIDVDSFQFGVYPCLVGTEAFTDPRAAIFKGRLALKPENDWYAFLVLWFRALTLAHPYGGTHPKVPLLAERARQRITIFDPAVTKPEIAYPFELLSDDLLHLYDQWFAKGNRGALPLDALQTYRDSLMRCPTCGASYPANRAYCPLCHTSGLTPAQSVRVLLETGGPIVTWTLAGGTLRAIAHEKDQAVLYEVANGVTRRIVLFGALPDATYAFLADKLIISPTPESDELLIVDIAASTPSAFLKTTTDRYANRGALFAVSNRSLYRIAGGALMRGQFDYGQLVERQVLAIARGQTWFCAASDDQGRERLFGYFRTLQMYSHWLLTDGEQYTADLTPLDAGELLIDNAVKFASGSVLITRLTQANGADRVRLDEIDLHGKLLQAKVLNDPAQLEAFEPIDAPAYSRDVLLHATDRGVIQHRLSNDAEKLFMHTVSAVRRGDTLIPHEDGLLAIGERRIVHIRAR